VCSCSSLSSLPFKGSRPASARLLAFDFWAYRLLKRTKVRTLGLGGRDAGTQGRRDRAPEATESLSPEFWILWVVGSRGFNARSSDI
jgi:hypothetical protein